MLKGTLESNLNIYTLETKKERACVIIQCLFNAVHCSKCCKEMYAKGDYAWQLMSGSLYPASALHPALCPKLTNMDYIHQFPIPWTPVELASGNPWQDISQKEEGGRRVTRVIFPWFSGFAGSSNWLLRLTTDTSFSGCSCHQAQITSSLPIFSESAVVTALGLQSLGSCMMMTSAFPLPDPDLYNYHILPCMMCAHILGAGFQEKDLSF